MPCLAPVCCDLHFQPFTLYQTTPAATRKPLCLRSGSPTELAPRWGIEWEHPHAARAVKVPISGASPVRGQGQFTSCRSAPSARFTPAGAHILEACAVHSNNVRAADCISSSSFPRSHPPHPGPFVVAGFVDRVPQPVRSDPSEQLQTPLISRAASTPPLSAPAHVAPALSPQRHHGSGRNS